MKKSVKILSILTALVLCIAMITACTPNTEEKMRKAYEDEDYIVISINNTQLSSFGLDQDDISWGVYATKITERATAICFSSNSKAKDFYNENIKDNYDSCFVSGKIVVFGSEVGVKIAK